MNKLFAYPGGKSPIRKQVVSAFPPHDSYKTYVDVFGGSAAILLEKEPSPGEIFNDKNEMLVNFFRVVKHRPAELAERAKNWIHSRSMWNELCQKEIQTADEIERAFIFWIRLQDSFGAMGITYSMIKKGIHSVTHSRNYISDVSKRLEGVHIECCSFERCFKYYDSPTTFFYLDPPYPDTQGGDSHYNLLSIEEWELMHGMLKNIQGKFLLSCNNHPRILKLFKNFNIQKFQVRTTLVKNAKPRTEILVSNYSMPRVKQHLAKYIPNRSAVKRSSKKVVRKELAQ